MPATRCPSGNNLRQIDDADGDAALIHNIARKNKERDGEQAEYRYTGKYPLRAGQDRNIEIHNRKNGTDRRYAQCHGNRYAGQKHNDQQHQNNQAAQNRCIHADSSFRPSPSSALPLCKRSMMFKILYTKMIQPEIGMMV